MQNFALIGAAGYVAPRHMQAIQATGHELVAAYDPFDSVGVMDRYFPEAAFFVEFERFDRHLDKLRRRGKGVDYVSICSPNYLHDAHIRFGLRQGADVICEKPLVLNPWNIDALAEMEAETGRRVYNILQLRLHESVKSLKAQVDAAPPDQVFDVNLTYITSRGHWYYTSWKGEEARSGGIATNIGVHFFDLLLWVFGGASHTEVHVHTHDRAAGFMQLKRARVQWFLSINADTLPAEVQAQGLRTYRALQIEDQDFEFSTGFEDLHTRSYAEILAGRGFPIDAARAAIEMVHAIRSQVPIGPNERAHPLAHLPLVAHPFQRK